MAIRTNVDSEHAVVQHAPSNLLSNPYGHFDPATLEFVLSSLHTPRPWTNVLSNGDYGLVLSHTGGGFSWRRNSQLERLTRWEQDLAVDAYGRWLYLYESSTDSLFSTTFAPLREPAEFETVRHGLGYTVFERRFADLRTSHTVFVPEGACAEHWLVEVENRSGRDRELRLGGYLEWFLGPQGDWHREFHRLFVSLEAADRALFAWKRPGLVEGARVPSDPALVAYLAVAGLEGLRWFGDKAQWLGPEGRLERPEALIDGRAPHNTGRWDDPAGAFTAPLALPAGATVRFAVTLGAEDALACARGAAEIPLAEIERRLSETRDFHRERCGALQIETGDPAFDLMNNGWLPFQAEVGRMKARCAYYQQGGAYGYRDQLQDSLALLETDPGVTERQIALHAEAMYEDGGVRHWWHPGTEIFVPSHHSDTCLWLAYATLEHLEETGDFEALARPLRFLSRETQGFAGQATLLDHCRRGIQRFLDDRTDRGLPRIRGGDWNDGLSHVGIDGKGESVWLAMFGYLILNRFAEVLTRTGDAAGAAEYQAEAERLRVAVETHGWDGEWYLAGTRDDGRPFGSQENREGRIFLNPQTWAVISGIASPERAAQAMGAVRRHLIKPYGALLLSPAYAEVDPFIGYITRYAPGLRENGGVYSHASTWAVQALAQMGDSEGAQALYRSMLPPVRAAADASRYQAEPYVMPGNVDGSDSPYEGRAGWTWYTGSAAWMRRIGVRWILGVRPEWDGLTIAPSRSAGLGRVSLVRPFRGDRFYIAIEPGARHRLLVDGAEHPGGPIPASGEGRDREVVAQAID